MGRRRQVGVGQLVAGEPRTGSSEIADVAQMIAQIGARHANRVHVRRAAAVARIHIALVDLLGHQQIAGLGVEFDVEPAHQPPDLHPAKRVLRQQPAIAEGETARLVEIFGNHVGARHGWRTLLAQHRRRALGVEQQELASPLPRPLLDQCRLHAEFGQDKPNEA